jgi:hypothetical protein
MDVIYGITQEKYDQLTKEVDKIKKPAVWNGIEWVSIISDNGDNNG